MIRLIFIIFLFLGGSAWATPTPPLAARDILIPPAKYDHPYRGHWQKEYMSFDELQYFCPGTVACTVRETPKYCRTRFALGITKEAMNVLLHHERAHCNGWGRPDNEHPKD